MLNSARERAKKKGIPFDLSPDDIRIPEVCPPLGIHLQRGRGKNGPSPNSPSLDRKDPSKGYARGNVWVISWKANRIKMDATGDEIRLLAQRLTENGI